MRKATLLAVLLLLGCKRASSVDAIRMLEAIAQELPPASTSAKACPSPTPSAACDLTAEERREKQAAIRDRLEIARTAGLLANLYDRRDDLTAAIADDLARTRTFMELVAADHLGLVTPAERAEFAEQTRAYERQLAIDLRAIVEVGNIERFVPLLPELDALTDEQLVRLWKLQMGPAFNARYKARPLRFANGDPFGDADLPVPP